MTEQCWNKLIWGTETPEWCLSHFLVEWKNKLLLLNDWGGLLVICIYYKVPRVARDAYYARGKNEDSRDGVTKTQCLAMVAS